MSSYVSQIVTNIFKYNNLEIYCVKSDGYTIWFGAAEIAKGFNYQNINQTIKNKVNNEDKIKLKNLINLINLNQYVSININLTPQEQNILYINEFGLYSLMFETKNQDKDNIDFYNFISHYILPSMRRIN